MAVLETIRVKIGWLITALIAIALLSFIVDFNSLSSAINSTSSKYAVGEINGKNVQYKDFQEQVEYQTSIAELLGGNTANSDEGLKQIRNSAWQYFVDQYLFLKNAKAAGIEVSKAEMVDLTSGDNISPILAYDPVFGGQGNFDKDNFKNFIKNLDSDASGNSKMYWEYVQNNILTQQYYVKYGSLFSATNFATKLVLNDAVKGNNETATVESVMVPFGFDRDSTITVSSNEIKNYYNSHKEQFRQVANRDIAYAYFEVVPSEADLQAANDAVVEVYDEFAATDNMKNFLMRNSEQSYIENYFKQNELSNINSEIAEFVFSGAGETSPVVKSGNEYLAARVLNTKVLPDSVYVRHILIQNNDKLVDSLMTVLKAGQTPFSQLAALYSVDQNERAAAPGDLGWMTQTYMIPGMESVISAELNKPFVLTTQYGKHIVEVTAKTKGVEKKQIAILKKTAVPSKTTMNEFYNKANALATKAAGNLELLKSVAKEDGVYLFEINVTEATANYNGATRAKEVTRWIFDAKKDEVSNVITVNQNYLFVVGVKEIHKEGYAKVQEVASRINNILYTQKQADKVAAEVAEKINGCTTMEAVAAALNLTATTTENVAFASMSYSNEPAFCGAASVAEPGKVTGPVKGVNGVYVLCVKDRNEGSFYTEDDARQMESQKGQYVSQMILPAMLESSKSVDNRERFY